MRFEIENPFCDASEVIVDLQEAGRDLLRLYWFSAL